MPDPNPIVNYNDQTATYVFNRRSTNGEKSLYFVAKVSGPLVKVSCIIYDVEQANINPDYHKKCLQASIASHMMLFPKH